MASQIRTQDPQTRHPARILPLALGLALSSTSLHAQKASPIRWSTIGNSITYGYGLSDPNTQSYPVKLGRLLGPAYQIENEGVSATTLLKNGNYTYWKNGRLPQTFAFKPDIVTIKLGTNDSKPVNWPAHKGEFLGDALAMIDTLAGMPSKPRIMPCYPVPVFQHNGTWSVDGINDPVIKNEIIPLLKQAADQRHLTHIDLHTFLENRSDLFTTDGVHPDAGKAGPDSIALQIFRTYLGAVTRVACIGDSITGSDRGGSSYPVKFNELLGREYYVLNAGAPGAGLLRNGPKPFAQSKYLDSVFRFQPNVVTINLGAFDSPSAVWDAHKDELAADLGWLIDTLAAMASKPRVFVCTPIPAWKKADSSESYGVRGAVIQNEIIPKLKQVAQAKGAAVLDLWSGYQAYPRLTPDGVVPNAEGLDTLAHILFRAYQAAPPVALAPASGKAALRTAPRLGPWEASGRDALGRRPRIPQDSRPPLKE
jgi:lysophospholipase L1-like esterase